MFLPHIHRRRTPWEKFLEKYGRYITGTLSCFDRVIFKVYLPLGWPEATES